MKLSKFFFFLLFIILLTPINLLANNIIGVWSGEHLEGRFSIKEVTIIKTKKSEDSYKMIIEWKNGSESKHVLIKKGDKYIDIESNFGEYQKIDPSGKLKMFDEDGLIFVLVKR